VLAGDEHAWGEAIAGGAAARVVGPAGEDIHTDQHGRIKVQFHWDRVGREDESSSCWFRSAQNMGGAGWGFVFIPRIGMEVVVQFIEGDRDRPLVKSVVYNSENPTPYGLPEEKTKTSLKTWSTPKTGGYNAMRFEDMAGLEQLHTQAERNMDMLVKSDQSLMVNRRRAKHVQGNETNNVDRHRSTQVGGRHQLNHARFRIRSFREETRAGPGTTSAGCCCTQARRDAARRRGSEAKTTVPKPGVV